MKVLYIIDAQNDFCSENGSLKNDECIKSGNNIVNLLKNEKFDKIYYTLDTHFDNYLDTQEGKNLPVRHCIYNTEGWLLRKDIMDEISKAVKSGTTVDQVVKETFGSFMLVEEPEHRYKSDDEIYICGFCTDICVISNALLLKSVNLETPIYFIENCSAGVTPEKHKSAVEVMKSCQINIINK